MTMAATDRARMTDAHLRKAVKRIMERRAWTTNRVAAEVGCSETTLIAWLKDPRATALTGFRRRLFGVVEQWDPEHGRPTASAPALVTVVRNADATPAPANPWADEVRHAPGPRVAVREDDLETQLAANGWMRDVLSAHGIPIPPPMLADLNGSTTRLRAAIKR